MGGRMWLLLFAILAALLTACSPSEEAVQTVIGETAVAAPTSAPAITEAATPISPTDTPRPTEAVTETPTATALSLTAIDLKSIVLANNENLTPPLQPDFVDHELTMRQDYLGELARPDNFISQKFYNSDRDSTGGAIIIFVYEDKELVDAAYGIVAPQLDGLGVGVGISYYDDVGEKAKLEEIEANSILIFQRCHAFAFIWMQDTREFDIVNYAKELDARLASVVCSAE